MRNVFYLLVVSLVMLRCTPTIEQKKNDAALNDTFKMAVMFPNRQLSPEFETDSLVIGLFNSHKNKTYDFKYSKNEKGMNLTASYIPIQNGYMETKNTWIKNLQNLVGRSLTVYRQPAYGRILLVPGGDYKIDTFSLKPTVIEDGKLTEYKITRENQNSLNFILGNVSISNNYLYQYLINEVSEISIPDKCLDMSRLKSAYSNDNGENYIIIGAKSIEIISKSFKDMAFNANAKVPVSALGGAVGYNGKVYNSESSYNKIWRVYVDLIEVKEIIKAHQ